MSANGTHVIAFEPSSEGLLFKYMIAMVYSHNIVIFFECFSSDGAHCLIATGVSINQYGRSFSYLFVCGSNGDRFKK